MEAGGNGLRLRRWRLCATGCDDLGLGLGLLCISHRHAGNSSGVLQVTVR